MRNVLLVIGQIFTESAHLAYSVSKSRCPSVCVSVCRCHFFCSGFKFLITPTYNGRKFDRPTAKRFLSEKLRKDIGLRFSNFCSEMVKNCRAEKSFFLVFASQFPGLSLVHGHSPSTIELKRRGRRASSLESKRRGLSTNDSRGCKCSVR